MECCFARTYDMETTNCFGGICCCDNPQQLCHSPMRSHSVSAYGNVGTSLFSTEQESLWYVCGMVGVSVTVPRQM